MNIALWVVQGLLAVAFLMAGGMKATQPKEKLQENLTWVEDFSDGAVRGIGIVELLGALGLILPMLTGILPILTPIAAVGLVLTMAGAAATHARRGETNMLAPGVVLGLLALFVAYGRFVLVPVM